MSEADQDLYRQDGSPLPLPATTLDVANAAGVSLRTVSRVFSESGTVSKKTSDRVHAAARVLGFRRNYIARELRRGGVSRTVGFVIGDLSNPFYAKVAAGVENVLAENGLTMIIAATDDQEEQESSVVASMLERGILALLLVPIARNHSYLQAENTGNVPVVAVDRPLNGAESNAILISNRRGASSAVQLLIDSGHHRIGFIGSSTTLYTHGERLEGYRETLQDNGIPLDAALERTDGVSADSACKAAEDLLNLKTPPTAIFAANNRATVGVYTALRKHAEKTALIGFDDFDLAKALGITVVSFDPIEMGVMAAQLALANVSKPHPAQYQRAEVQTTLSIRTSHLLNGSFL